jgi:hypothetical protein
MRKQTLKTQQRLKSRRRRKTMKRILVAMSALLLVGVVIAKSGKQKQTKQVSRPELVIPLTAGDLNLRKGIEDLKKEYPDQAWTGQIGQGISDASAEEFFREVLAPFLMEIPRTYPVEKYRKEVAKIFDTGRLVNCFANRRFGNVLAFAGSDASGKKPAIIFNADVLTLRFAVAYSAFEGEKRREVLEDLLLCTILHEEYHISRQKFWTPSTLKEDIRTTQQVQNFELEAWRYSCDLYLKLKEKGRGVMMPGSTEERLLSLYTTDPHGFTAMVAGMYSQ